MTTFNRVDCARINQEIIKLNYSSPYPIVHSCSSSTYEQYLEDVFVPCEPHGLQAGALKLLQHSLASAIGTFSPGYVIHLEGDTWLMNEQVIHKIIATMDRSKHLLLCTSAWDDDLLAFEYLKSPRVALRLHLTVAGAVRRLGYPYRLTYRDTLATQFFVIRVVPEVVECLMSLAPIPGRSLEQEFHSIFMARFGEHNILRLRMREPIHPFNRYVCERLALFSQHWPARGTANDLRDPTHPRYIPPTADGKRETLLRFPSIRRGEHLQKLLGAESFEYYNVGASRT